MRLADPVAALPGVGPARAALLGRLGITTVGDLLGLLPRRYEDRRRLLAVRDLRPGEEASFLARVVSAGPEVTARGRRVFRAVLEDGTGRIEALWFRFRAPHLLGVLRPGSPLLLHGAVTLAGRRRCVLHPELEPAGEEGERRGPAIRPVYPGTEGLPQATLRTLVRRALAAALPQVEDPLPRAMRRRLGLPGLAESFAALHAPPDDAAPGELAAPASPWRRRLVFDELLGLQLALALRRQRHAAAPPRRPPSFPPGLLAGFIARLPFALTAAQGRACAEILGDLAGPRPMQRLLQGDVGSGKTVVAALAAVACAAAGGQAAVMVPTEPLAEQHFLTFSRLAGALGAEPALLTRGVPRERREAVLAGLAAGRLPLVVGTHALLEGKVRFADLRLAIVDEQHRFGVRQRVALRGKGGAPDLLVMTATPIPRSLALALYGDLDLSVIDELPPGRRPVETCAVGEEARAGVWEAVRAELARGRRAFVVCPLVEQGEGEDTLAAVRTAERLRAGIFRGIGVGLVHGGMPFEERAAALERFRGGATPLLVATTVVEVGLDVPEATVMVVERAERFGLAQLHQLRGRVGRGADPARCFLLVGPRPTPEARERLAVLETTADGFAVAEADLRQRGPGELAGTRQAGLAGLRLADLARDGALLAAAREEALRIARLDPGLDLPEHASLRSLPPLRRGGPAAAGGSG